VEQGTYLKTWFSMDMLNVSVFRCFTPKKTVISTASEHRPYEVTANLYNLTYILTVNIISDSIHFKELC
jgi:hypothetical protein